MLAVGVDGCTAGWVGVALDEHGFVGAVLAPTIDDLAAQLPDADGFGIDIPIGLLTDGFRAADRLARRQVGPRAASVYLTPPRAVLEVDDHQKATLLAVQLTGSGISRQAHGLRQKILEVDRWLRADLGGAEPEANPADRGAAAVAGHCLRPSAPPVWEIHPEVSFYRDGWWPSPAEEQLERRHPASPTAPRRRRRVAG